MDGKWDRKNIWENSGHNFLKLCKICKPRGLRSQSGFISKIKTILTNLFFQLTDNLMGKWARDLNRHFTKENIQLWKDNKSHQ